jgi:hypothetical protein
MTSTLRFGLVVAVLGPLACSATEDATTVLPPASADDDASVLDAAPPDATAETAAPAPDASADTSTPDASPRKDASPPHDGAPPDSGAPDAMPLPTPSWVLDYTNGTDDYVVGMGFDANNRLYLAETNGYGTDVITYDTSGAKVWDRPVLASPTEEYAVVSGKAFHVSPQGDSWLAATVHWGQISSNDFGHTDVLVAKVAADGTVVVSKEFGVDQKVTLYRIAAAPDGGAVIVGRLAGSVDVLGGALQGDAFDGGAYVAKIDATGTFVWGTVLSTNPENTLAGLGISPAGEVYVSGQGCSPDFGAGPIWTGGTYFCDDFFLAKLGPDGHQIWGKGVGVDSFSDDFTGPLVALADGSVAVAGMYSQGPLDFGSGAFPNVSGTAPFIVAYAPDGALRFAKLYAALGVSSFGAYATNLRLAAAPSGEMALGGHSLSDPTTGGVLEQAFWLDKDGTPGQSRTVRTHDCHYQVQSGKPYVWSSVALRSDRTILLAGSYASGLDVGTASRCADRESYAQYDAFVAAFAP